jgi:His-Xaa-Ser system radical SAM maturase HxsB
MSKTDFLDLRHYQPPTSAFGLLPFRFERFGEKEYLLTNDLGELAIVDGRVFMSLLGKTIDTTSESYLDLRSKYFVSDDRGSVHARVMASKYRTKKSFLDGFAKLHIFVVSLRCDHSCPYCQVSRQSEDKTRYDMTGEIGRRGVDLMLQVPALAVTCEFQGGETLLNFPLVQEIVEYASERNREIGKQLSFVVCTNLSTLTDDHLDYFRKHGILVSTSLDGPAALHDRNRPFSKGSSHAVVERNLRRVQEALEPGSVSALMTTTKDSLRYPVEIIDEYLRLGLGSIFLRPLSPYGFAVKTAKAIGYDMRDFLNFYRRALDYIIEVNRGGRTFAESYATLILKKILTPYPTGYVDLQSPAGAGFGVVVYNYDGEVYASDEARMLAEMGDTSFRLGNVLENDYQEIFFGDRMQAIATAACNEALAGCADCALQPFCGADPVYHYATQGDMFGNRAASGFCKRNMSIIRDLIHRLHAGDRTVEEIFWAWINKSSVAEQRLPEPAWL